jgi:CheY-like chemotaxis protein
MRYEIMAQSAPLNSPTILIVENEAIVRMELAAQLTDFGFKVLVASDADEAIDLLDSHQEIELLLTDVTMPGSMDGVRLAHHVRKRWPPIKIVVTSGRLGTKLSDLPLGSAFFPKPYGSETLRKTLTPFLSGNRAEFGGGAARAAR